MPQSELDGSTDVGGIILKACRQTGFRLDRSRLIVETVKAKDGMTVCVTRLPGGRTPVFADNERRSCETEPYIFAFESVDALLRAGEAVLRHPDVLQGRLCVIFSGGRWYLTFSPVLAGLDGYRLDCLLSHVSEFGEQLPGGSLFEARLIENGKPVAFDAEAERLFLLAAYPSAANSEPTAAFTSAAPKM